MTKRIGSTCAAAFLLCLAGGTLHAQVSNLFSLRESNGAAGKHKYSIFVPHDYSPTAKMPMIVFLHGVGEAGSDGITATSVGLGPFIAGRNGDFPFVAIFPQTGWDWTSKTSEQIVLDTQEDVKKDYPGIDWQRVSLMGISSGGKGTWVLGARHPDIFAALVPLAGFKALDEIPRLTKIPIWVVHNRDDFVVQPSNSQEMVNAIKKANPDAPIRYDEYPDGGHDCWDKLFANPEFFAWLGKQRLPGGNTATSAPSGRP